MKNPNRWLCGVVLSVLGCDSKDDASDDGLADPSGESDGDEADDPSGQEGPSDTPDDDDDDGDIPPTDAAQTTDDGGPPEGDSSSTGGSDTSTGGSESTTSDPPDPEGESSTTEDPGDDGESTTPLVLSFDGDDPRFSADTTAAFDNDVAGGCLSTDWPTAATPWLVRDVDGDGVIADGRELFGSGTRLRSGLRARDGFAALSELDRDGDGKLGLGDPAFSELLIWSDEDHDKRGTGTELRSLADLHIVQLDLGYRTASSCDARGNCAIERAEFSWVASGGELRHGEIVDVHLPCQ